jgi:hypothetical protein
MKNAIIGVLIILVLVLGVSFIRLAHNNKDLRRWNDSLKTQVNNLKGEPNKTGSNQVSDATSEPAPGAASSSHQD